MTIVLCCGVFDVLHAGHVHLLRHARMLGGPVIVGINSDASAAALDKGRNRPINSAKDRRAVLRSIRFVDFVYVFNAETPEGLIRLVRPAVYLKGGDYSVKTLPEAAAVYEVGGTIKIIRRLPGRSSTATLRRMGVE